MWNLSEHNQAAAAKRGVPSVSDGGQEPEGGEWKRMARANGMRALVAKARMRAKCDDQPVLRNPAATPLIDRWIPRCTRSSTFSSADSARCRWISSTCK